MEPQASVIIPLLNQPDKWLEQCVDSAIGQTVHCEVIVVVSSRTGPSNIDTLKRKNAESLLIVPEDGESFPIALNTGIHKASTDRVRFLLSDDWLEPNAVEKCLSHSKDIVSTNKTQYDATGTKRLRTHRSPRMMAGFHRMRTLEEKADYLTHFFLFERETLRAVGGVDETIGLTGSDDYDLIWTLLEHGATVGIVEMSLYNKRDHSGSRLTLRSPEEQVEDFKKILDKHGVFGKQRERLIRAKSKWFGAPLHVAAQKMREEQALWHRWKRAMGRIFSR
ncbi:MAG: glycosyltransferase [Gammaproteobacteria bacterium]|nr:glycosyltransferase [Gammaproteobacteria bacterium]